MEKADIEFKARGKKIKFSVNHNLSEFGLNIEDAVHNWVYRTNEYTAKSFCQYVVSKDPINLICIPKK